jgi:outer membrane murein-binding lipoprotein Lpp
VPNTSARQVAPTAAAPWWKAILGGGVSIGVGLVTVAITFYTQVHTNQARNEEIHHRMTSELVTASNDIERLSDDVDAMAQDVSAIKAAQTTADRDTRARLQRIEGALDALRTRRR